VVAVVAVVVVVVVGGQPGQRLDGRPPVRGAGVDQRVVVAGRLAQHRRPAGPRGRRDVALAVAEGHLVVAARVQAQHGRRQRHGRDRVGEQVPLRQFFRVAAHQVGRRRAAYPVARAVRQRQHPRLRDDGDRGDPR